ncbi:serum response factor-like isoform X2 [Genypterus blacodes]|uniref:serum response factor-like isoform X2 n=1 Tax=Genypterus blacodes TaxID=154954 RepID=UPI003F776712
MLGGNGAEMGSRAGPGRAGNESGLASLPVNTSGPGTTAPAETLGGGFGDREYSGSEQDSDSVDEEDTASAGADRRGVKRERSDREVAHHSVPTSGGSAGVPGAKPGKKTRGRVKIKMEFIDNKLRRYTTFSKRKTGIMKKAYELSTLTGTQVLLLVASETGHVYTFATRKLQPMITSETGKALIQTCLNSPDSPPRCDPTSDQRMSATGFEETDLTYQVSEVDGCCDVVKDAIKPTFTAVNPPGSSVAQPTAASVASSSASFSHSSSLALQVQTGASSCPSSSGASPSTNGTVLKPSAGVVLPGGFTFMSGTHTIPLSQLHTAPLSIQGSSSTGGMLLPQPTTLLRLPATVSLSGGAVSQQLQTIQVQPGSQQASSSQSSSELHSPASSTVMYAAPSPSLSDGGLTVLNTFPQPAHGRPHDPGAVPQVFLTSLPPAATQIPMSAVQLHPIVLSQQGGSSSNLTELQVVSLDVHQSKDN